MLAQFSAGQQRTQRRIEGGVVALGGAAGVAIDRVLRRRAVHTRGVIVGVAHARGGHFGEHGFQGGAQLGGQPAMQLRHAVGLLLTERESASPGPVFVGVSPVRIQVIGDSISERAELLRSALGPDPR